MLGMEWFHVHTGKADVWCPIFQTKLLTGLVSLWLNYCGCHWKSQWSRHLIWYPYLATTPRITGAYHHGTLVPYIYRASPSPLSRLTLKLFCIGSTIPTWRLQYFKIWGVGPKMSQSSTWKHYRNRSRRQPHRSEQMPIFSCAPETDGPQRGGEELVHKREFSVQH